MEKLENKQFPFQRSQRHVQTGKTLLFSSECTHKREINRRKKRPRSKRKTWRIIWENTLTLRILWCGSWKKKQEKQTTRQEKHRQKRRENPEKSIRFPEANFSSLFKFITEFFSPAHPPQTLRDESRTNGGKLWINIFYIYMWKMRALSSLGNVCSICHTSVVRAAILWCKGTASSSQQFDGCWRTTCESHLHFLFGMWERSFVWCKQLNLKPRTSVNATKIEFILSMAIIGCPWGWHSILEWL